MNIGTSIPVLMYHTVGRVIEEWKWSYLTVPPETFENQLRWLKKKGFTTIDLDELYAHVSGTSPLSGNHVVLTFDDGYLDNWTHAAPLLRKYGFKAVVYVNPEFVDPAEELRPTMEDVWSGRLKEDELETRGFMSWPELRQIADEGVFSVQSHLMTHTWYPLTDSVVDFRHPGDDYYWLDWNQIPLEKFSYLRKLDGRATPYGFPVYEHAKSAVVRRYFPEKSEGEYLANSVAGLGGNFFNLKNWRSLLFAELERYRNIYPQSGRIETEEEYVERLHFELRESRAILEQQLGRPVEFMAWPGGGYDEKAVILSLDVYKAITLGSRDRSGVRNRTGDDPRLVKRCGVPYVEKNGTILYQGGRYLYHYLREFQGSQIHRFARKGLQILAELSC